MANDFEDMMLYLNADSAPPIKLEVKTCAVQVPLHVEEDENVKQPANIIRIPVKLWRQLIQNPPSASHDNNNTIPNTPTLEEGEIEDLFTMITAGAAMSESSLPASPNLQSATLPTSNYFPPPRNSMGGQVTDIGTKQLIASRPLLSHLPQIQHNVPTTSAAHYQIPEDSRTRKHSREHEIDEPDSKRRRVGENQSIFSNKNHYYHDTTRHAYSLGYNTPINSPRTPNYSHLDPGTEENCYASSEQSPMSQYGSPMRLSDSQEFIPFIKSTTELIIFDTNWVIRFYEYLFAFTLPQMKSVHVVILNQIAVELDRLKQKAKPEERMKFQRAAKWLKKFINATKDVKRFHHYKSKKQVDTADQEILEAAQHFKKYTSNIVVLTEDQTLSLQLLTENVKCGLGFVVHLGIKLDDGVKYYSSEKEPPAPKSDL